MRNSKSSETTLGRLLDARQTRRETLRQIGAAALLASLPSALPGQEAPATLKANKKGFNILTAGEAATLEALGDTLLPGAADAGIAYYVDRQLGSAEPLLMLRYLDFPEPFADFYRQGLAALDALSTQQYRHTFAGLTAEQQTQVVLAVSKANPDGWKGPPAPLFYFATRNDAVDVFYGTIEGFEKLNVPYMAHIAPAEPW